MKDRTTIGKEAKERWRGQLRPVRALGKLEDWAFRLAEVLESPAPRLERPALALFIGDHGVAYRGVSAMSPDATRVLLRSLSGKGTAADVFGSQFNVEIVACDVGSRVSDDGAESIRDLRVRRGTEDFTLGPAMTGAEVEAAAEVGCRIVRELRNDGTDVLGVGEIGIGNTTAAAAIVSKILNLSAEETVGPGTGVSGDQLRRKIQVVNLALDRLIGKELDAWAVLREVGGLEIAALVGALMEAERLGLPVVIDGYVTSTAALIANRLGCSLEGAFFAHLTREPGQVKILEDLRASPLLELELSIGEGVGAILGLSILRLCSRIFWEVSVFDDENRSGLEL